MPALGSFAPAHAVPNGEQAGLMAVAFGLPRGVAERRVEGTSIYYVSEWAFTWLHIGDSGLAGMADVNRVCVELIMRPANPKFFADVYGRLRILRPPATLSVPADIHPSTGVALIVMPPLVDACPFHWAATGAVAAAHDARARGLVPAVVVVQSEGGKHDHLTQSAYAQDWLDRLVGLGFQPPVVLRCPSAARDAHDVRYYTNTWLEGVVRSRPTMAALASRAGWSEPVANA